MPRVNIGLASRRGTEHNNADHAATFTTEAGTTAAAVIDLAGHHDNAPVVARLLAETAARVAAQRGGPAGLLSAGLLVADPGADPEPEPDGVAVVAVAHPDGPTVISWCGDSHGYGWDGTRLHQYTTPHTYGQQLREYGAPWNVAAGHDDWLLTSLSHATVAGIVTVTCPDPLIILTSDGLDALPMQTFTDLVRTHAHNPPALAAALVAAVPTSPDGYRDDTTVITIATPPNA